MSERVVQHIASRRLDHPLALVLGAAIGRARGRMTAAATVHELGAFP